MPLRGGDRPARPEMTPLEFARQLLNVNSADEGLQMIRDCPPEWRGQIMVALFTQWFAHESLLEEIDAVSVLGGELMSLPEFDRYRILIPQEIPMPHTEYVLLRRKCQRRLVGDGNMPELVLPYRISCERNQSHSRRYLWLMGCGHALCNRCFMNTLNHRLDPNDNRLDAILFCDCRFGGEHYALALREYSQGSQQRQQPQQTQQREDVSSS